MLNRCEFIGNLGRDPEVRNTQSGDRVVSFSLAVSERWRDKNGEQKDRTTWVPIVIWNQKLGEVAEKYLRKGSKVFVAGAFTVRKWQDQSGQEKYSTEVVLQQFKGELTLLDGRNEAGSQSSAPSASRSPGRSSADELEDFDSQIPF